MKYILLIPFLFILSCNDSGNSSSQAKESLAVALVPKTYWASPTGSDSNPGTQDKPFYTWEKLASVLGIGDTGWVRGGTYKTTKASTVTQFCKISNKNGIYLSAYKDEKPVFDFSTVKPTGTPTVYAMYIQGCSNSTFKGLRAAFMGQPSTAKPDRQTYTYGFFIDGGSNISLINCESDHNCEGFAFSNAQNITVTNCDAHHLEDPYSPTPYGGSNGFSSTGGQSSTITFNYCRAWWCSDDGWDFYKSDGVYKMNGCEAFWCGYKPDSNPRKEVGNGSGFKIGPNVANQSTVVKKYLTYCISFENSGQGYDCNAGQSINSIINCTSYGNKDNGYLMCCNNIKNILTNNIAFADRSSVCKGSSVSVNNTWDSNPAKSSDFISTSSIGMDAPRKPNGDLPDNTFMHLANTNQKGRGAYPDGVVPPPVILPPVVSAASTSVTVVTLTGIASDPQGQSMTYSWTQVDGTPVTIINGNQLVANATFTATGTYHFKFTATNTSNLSSSTTIPITIK